MVGISLLLLHGCGLDPVYFPSNDTGYSTTSGTHTGDGDADSDADSDADADSDTDSDADSDPNAPTISAIDPTYGTTYGGDKVTITGSNLSSSTKVKFGSKNATVVSAKANEMVVTTPSQSTSDVVDVTVSDGKVTDSLPGAFTYYLDGTGKYGTFGEFTWSNYVGSGWKPPAQGGPTDGAYAGLYELAAYTTTNYWELFAPQMESCRSEFTSSASISIVSANGIDDLVLDRGSGTVNVPWGKQNGNSLWYADSLNASQWQASTSYDIDIPAINGYPAAVIKKGVTTPASFSVTKPDFDLVTPVSKSNFSIVWSGGAAADYMVATLDLYDAASSTVQEEVTCAFNDDGSFTVPANTWSTWTSGRALVVVLGRVRESTGTIPYNNATSGMVGISQVLGVAFTQ